MLELNKIYCGDNLTLIKQLDGCSVDLTVTSPPYDNLRDYKGYSWDFEGLAKELYRVTKDGGVIVWVVADATINGSETGTSFKQALYFKEIGFNLHDTMIYSKPRFSAVGALQSRYAPVFEYMFILSKGKIKTFNPLKDRKTKGKNNVLRGTIRNSDGTMKRMSGEGKICCKDGFGIRYNIWEYSNPTTGHPAPFPLKLAEDHILSWSNELDTVLDPFIGGGTTAIGAIQQKRNYIGFELSQEYCDIANERIRKLNERK